MENPPWLGNRLSEYVFVFLGTPNQQIQAGGPAPQHLGVEMGLDLKMLG